MNRTLDRIGGTVSARVIREPKAPLSWRVRNAVRVTFLYGLIVNWLAKQFSHLTGIPTITAELAIRVYREGAGWMNYGTVSHRVVTDAGVAFIVDDWDNSATDITNFNYHASGTGTTAEAASQTALVTEVEATRATGTKSQPTANQLRTVGTISYTATRAITEHGIFSATTTGTMWDRSLFTALNVNNGDSIQFTYTCTVNSGG